MSNYIKVSLENAPRIELHDKLGLTGAEITFVYKQRKILLKVLQ